MRMTKPRGQSHIVNHLAFSDAAPTIGSKNTTYNPSKVGGSSPPRYVQPSGVRRTKAATSDPASTQKRY